MAAPATKPVAATAAAWTAGSIAGEGATTAAHLGQHGHALHRLISAPSPATLQILHDVGVDDRAGPLSMDWWRDIGGIW